jgi:hypothetical protein
MVGVVWVERTPTEQVIFDVEVVDANARQVDVLLEMSRDATRRNLDMMI